MRKILLGLFICLTLKLSSTCIVIMFAENKFYVVSDTRNTVSKYEDGVLKWTKNDTINKIRNIGSYYFAISGHNDKDLQDIINKTIKASAPLGGCVKRFSEKLKLHYSVSMLKLKQINKPKYEWYIENGLTAAFFFAFKNDKPITYHVELSLNEIKNSPSISYKIDSSKTEFIVLGMQDHMDDNIYIKLIKECKGNSLVLGESIINHEMKFHPNDIAYPIDQLILSTKGVQMRNRKIN